MRPVSELLALDGRTAVVTGGSGRIGAGIAVRLAEAGAQVGVHYQSSEERASAVVKQIRARGGRAEAFEADLTRAAGVSELHAAAAARLGPVTILVNNAGIYPVTPFLDMTQAEWDETLDANLRSVFLCAQTFARGMSEDGAVINGAIINIASIEGDYPAPGHSHYSASKAAVLMHTRATAAELGPLGIRVNAVSPGLIHRDGIEAAWPDGVERWLAACPLRRLGLPEDVADACLFLASDAARWITGVNLVVDGGVTTGPPF